MNRLKCSIYGLYFGTSKRFYEGKDYYYLNLIDDEGEAIKVSINVERYIELQKVERLKSSIVLYDCIVRGKTSFGGVTLSIISPEGAEIKVCSIQDAVTEDILSPMLDEENGS